MNVIVHQTFFFFVYLAASLLRGTRPAQTGQEDHFFRKKMVPITIGIAKNANPRATGTCAPMETANMGSRPGMEP